MISRRAHSTSDPGFVLVIVLALLVVLALLAAAVATSAERTIRAAQADSARFQAEVDMDSTRETLLFLMSTQRNTLAGLTVNPSDAEVSLTFVDDDDNGFSVLPVGNEIRLDGTAYRGLGRARFALQDDRGLLSLNWASIPRRFAFYESLGVPQNRWAYLEAKRLDYQDPDDLHRLNGAEKDHYRRAGLPPPSNRTLATPLEFRRIMDLGPRLADFDDARLLSTLTTSRTVALNLNTAPVEVLALIPGMDRERAERMVQLRRTAPFVSLWQTMQTFGIPLALEEEMNLFAQGSGSLIIWDGESGTRQLLHWTLMPSLLEGVPWRIDYEVTLPRGDADSNTSIGTPETPFLSDQLPQLQPIK